MARIAEALLFALPVIAGGVTHIATMKLGLLPGLARVPLDGGVTVRGRRLFGDNKTLRGASVMIAATAAASALLVLALPAGAPLAAAQRAHPLAWGALLGAGFLAGELPNSFAKRQLDIGPGDPGQGGLGPLFWFIDQVDSLVGVLLAAALLSPPPFAVVAWLVGITLVLHPLAALVMVGLGLKRRVG